MFNSTLNTKTDAAFQVSVYNAARTEARTSVATVALIRQLDWSDKELCERTSRSFRVGHYCGAANVRREDAIAVLDKAEKARTAEEQALVRRGISAWSHAAQLAGKPNAKTGAPRAERKLATPATPTVAPKDSFPMEAASIPTARTFDDVRTFALLLSGIAGKYQKKNEKLMGEYSAIFRDFSSAVRALRKAEAAVSENKTESTGGAPATDAE
jgi:hypothetical protein